MSFEKAILDTPWGRRLIAQKARELIAKHGSETARIIAEEDERWVREETARLVADAEHWVREEAARQTAEADRWVREEATSQTAEAELGTMRKCLLRLLQQRFGLVPKDLAGQLRAIHEQAKLDGLLDAVAACPDLETFRKALNGL